MNFQLSQVIKKEYLIASFFVTIVTIIVYLPALQNGFVNWDDPDYVYKNQYIQSFNIKSVKWMFTTFYMQNWHPLTWLSHAIDYAIWGLNPKGYHLTNIILHGLNTYLYVILVSLLLIKRPLESFSVSLKSSYYQNSFFTFAVTGLIFSLHPLRVESVAWISERKDVLCAFFYLLCIISYIKYVDSSQRKAVLYYILSIVFSIFALMSKPMAVTLPFVLLILDRYPLERIQYKTAFTRHKKVLLDKIPFFLLSFSTIIITIIAQQKEIKLSNFSISEKIIVGFKSVSFYLLKIAWPTHLVPLYPYPSNISFITPQYILSFLLILCITAFCIFLWKREKKIFLIVWGYFLLTLTPVLGIVKVGGQFVADRYTYLPSLGPTLLVGLGIGWVWEKTLNNKGDSILKRLTFAVFIIFIISILSVLTLQQIKIWKDSITLWDRELTFYKIPEAYNNRGNMYLESSEYQRALADYNESLKIDPNYSKAYNNRGLVFMKLGNYKQALKDLNKSININNKQAIAYYNRGNLYKTLREYQKAINDYTNAIELKPQYGDAYNNRGNTYLILNNLQKAILDFNIAININPMDDKIYINRALAFQKLGNYKQMIRDYQSAAKLGNKQAQVYLKLKGIKW